LKERLEDIEDLATHFLGILFNTYKTDSPDESPPHLDKAAINYLKTCQFPGNVRELKNILLRALLFSKSGTITKQGIISACQAQPTESDHHIEMDNSQSIDSILDRLESGEADFWDLIHKPFKENHLTRETVKNVIDTARSRYQANLPGLAIKLKACNEHFNDDPVEKRKFISFKNFLYKTVRITNS
jgi:DNA-binding NtrC family response regulator